MHITLEADYAVRIVHFLVCAGGQRMDAKAIAEKTGVTLRFSLKILRKLVAGGIVRSYKGTHGGYELAVDPKTLTLYDVLTTVEGPYALSRCVLPDFKCSQNSESCTACKFNAIYDDISKLVREKLSSVRFSDLA
mgnify:CR=1 FL=1